MNPDINALVQSGQYASKGAARRALGIEAEQPLIADSMQDWMKRLLAGLVGTRPKVR